MGTVGALIDFLQQHDRDAKVALRYSNHLHVGVLDFFNPKPKPSHSRSWTEGDQAKHLAFMAKFDRYAIEEYACEFTGRLWYEIVHRECGSVAKLQMGGREVEQRWFVSYQEAAGKIGRLP